MGPGHRQAMGGPTLRGKVHGSHPTTQHWHFCLLHKHWAGGICPTAIDSPVPAPQGVTAMVATLLASHSAHGWGSSDLHITCPLTGLQSYPYSAHCVHATICHIHPYSLGVAPTLHAPFPRCVGALEKWLGCWL